MSIRRWIAAAVTASFAILVTEAIAHHASGPFYDPENRVEFEGIVTRWVSVSYTHLTLPTKRIV